MIIICPYKAPETVKAIEASFEKINLAGLQLENSRYLNTKELSEEERKDRTLDFLGAFEIMDSEFRMFIIEGLGGKGRGLDKFYRMNERERPNDKKFKMLYNPLVRYKNRMYLDFNVAIKKIKLRDTLTKIMGSPDVYLRSKVPQDMYDTLQKFAEIRKADRAGLVRDFNLFPITQNLLTLERKYGDSLNHEDLYGFKQRRKRRAKNTIMNESGNLVMEDEKDGVTEKQSQMSLDKDGESAFGASVTQQTVLNAKPEEEESDEESEVVQQKRNPDTDCLNTQFEKSLRQRKEEDMKDYQRINIQTVHKMNSGRPLKQRIEVPEHVEVYPYGNQKGNIWEFQKEQLRKQIAKDSSNFYTYSKEHLSLSFPLVNENQIKVKEKEDNESRWKTKAGFDVHMKKTNYNQHPKQPHPATQDDLKYSYVDQKMETKMKLQDRQYQPAMDGKADFYSKVPNIRQFSDPDYFKTVFISGDDMMRELAQMKQKEIDDFEKKVVVKNKHFAVDTKTGSTQ